MKQIKPGEYKKAVCGWCPLRADYVALNLAGPTRYCCAAHQLNLSKLEARLRDDYMSEADYQTWGRL